MAVRRLHPVQPASFAFTPENLAWAETLVAKYPAGRQASAVIPLLWRGQEQEGWVSEPMLRAVGDMLDMAYIRVLEVATFYTMFQLSPVGRKAHVQVCGTTPCMLRGSEDLMTVCRRRIAEHQHEVSADGDFSWEEVECLGACVNAPMVQIGKDTWEDLTPETFEKVLDGFSRGAAPKPGPQKERHLAEAEGGATTLKDPALYDGSVVGSWRERFEATERAKAEAKAKAAAAAAPAGTGPAAPAAAPVPAKAIPAPQGKTEAAAASSAPAPAPHPATPTQVAAEVSKEGVALAEPALLKQPRGGKGDDLKLIWGVGEKLERAMNELGIWHFDQIAAWTPAEVAWFESRMQGFRGRIERDKWIEQCKKLMTGWRPTTDAGEKFGG